MSGTDQGKRLRNSLWAMVVAAPSVWTWMLAAAVGAEKQERDVPKYLTEARPQSVSNVTLLPIRPGRPWGWAVEDFMDDPRQPLYNATKQKLLQGRQVFSHSQQGSYWRESMRLIWIAGMVALAVSAAAETQKAPIQIGQPLGATNEIGAFIPLSSNVKVYGSFRFTESCTFDPERNLILAMNVGVGQDLQRNDGYVSLINPDGSVHTAKWIGATRENLTLNDPLGSAISKGILYTVDMGVLRSFDLKNGRALNAFEVPGATFLNGIGVTAEGTAYISNTRPVGRIYRVTADGRTSVFAEGPPLNAPNGVAIDREGNIVVVNVGDNAVLTFNPAGKLIVTEHAVESGNDGLIITEDGTKYVSSVRYGSVSRIHPGQPAKIVASGIPSAASMCYDSIQKQLVIPMNPNDALAFIPLAKRPR